MPTSNLTITIAQINPTIGDFSGNVNLAKDALEAAYSQHADLVVFPELSLCGYYPGDLLNEHGFIRKTAEALDELLALTASFPEISAIIGMPTKATSPGKPLFNSLLAIKGGKILAEYHKQLLPTYNIFDERRHFEPGTATAVSIDISGHKIGLMICEDGWNDDNKDYPINPYAAIAQINADLIISVNASPSNIGKREMRHQVICGAAKRYSLPILYVNQVGGQDSIVFDGASFAVNAKGGIAHEWPAFETVIDTIQFNGGAFLTGTAQALAEPSVTANKEEEFFIRQIVLGLQDYARRCGFSKVVVGSSGGIDSALTLALAVEALGANNVIAVTMPSQFSSTGSVSDSETLCQQLGVKLHTHPIKNLVDDYVQSYQEAFKDGLRGLALENLQARIRGTILMAYSNQSGALVLTTGNKSEISVGYCTLYGDTNGGLGIIGDLYKTEVYRLSEYVNERAGRVLIPNPILTKPPSAELAPGQKDTDSLPPYEVLDEILKILIEGDLLPSTEYKAANEFVTHFRLTPEGEDVYQRIARLVVRNEYKRRQAPPIIRVRPRAFGAGRQMPIAANY